MQRLSRDQKRLDVLRVDPATGKSSVLFSETSPTWVNLNDNFKPLKDGSLIWSSERSGFPHLYRWQAGKWTQLTSGNWAVEDVAGVDEKAGRVYFTGTAETPIEQQLYWVSYNAPGAPQRVTEQDWYNKAVMDKGATHALVTRSSPSQPSQTYLADAAGKHLAWVEQNALTASHPYAPYLDSHVKPTFGTVAGPDGTPLHYRMLAPKLVAGKRYPVFFYVYGGPHGQQVTDDWYKALPLHEALVDKGWIVFTIDNRGTNRRGTKFESAIYRKMGDAEVADQLAGVAWLKRQPFVDPGKVAVMGWSYGGYMTLKLLEKAPGRLRGRCGGRAGDQVGVVRYGLHRALPWQSFGRSDTLPDIGRAGGRGEDQGPAAARPRHVGRQCRVPELDRALRPAAAEQGAVRDDDLSRRHARDRGRGAADPRLDDDHPLPRRAGAGQALTKRAAVDQPGVEVPGRIAEPWQDEGKADEQRDRADDQQAEHDQAPADQLALVGMRGAP